MANAADMPPVIKLAILSSTNVIFFLKIFCKCCSPNKKKPASIILNTIAATIDKPILNKFIYKIIIKFYKYFMI